MYLQNKYLHAYRLIPILSRIEWILYLYNVFVFILEYSKKMLNLNKLVDINHLNLRRLYETVVPNFINIDFIHQKQVYFCEQKYNFYHENIYYYYI